MAEPALVRYYCLMGPHQAIGVRWWPTLAYRYLRALLTGISVRTIPLGAVNYQALDAAGWRHWQRVEATFQAELVERPLNVICCPFGIQQGHQARVRDMAPPSVPGFPRSLTAMPAVDLDEVVYEPMYALEACLTEGLVNVAITGTIPTWPRPAEVEALKKYDAIVTPTKKEQADLAELGVRAQQYAAKELAADIERFIAPLTGRAE